MILLLFYLRNFKKARFISFPHPANHSHTTALIGRSSLSTLTLLLSEVPRGTRDEAQQNADNYFLEVDMEEMNDVLEIVRA